MRASLLAMATTTLLRGARCESRCTNILHKYVVARNSVATLDEKEFAKIYDEVEGYLSLFPLSGLLFAGAPPYDVDLSHAGAR